MKKNYYEELIEKIDSLIKEQKKEEAISLIEEELKLPYVPMEYEKILKFFLSKIKPENPMKKNNKFNREEMLQIIREFEKHNIEFILEICNGFEEYNWKGFEKDIQDIFNLEGLDNKVKCIIYNTLVIQDLDFNFKFKKYILNPKINKTIFESQFAWENLSNLGKIRDKDPSLYDVCEKIFFIYIMNLFPASYFFNYRDVVGNIKNIASVMMGITQENSLTDEEKKIYEIIKGSN